MRSFLEIHAKASAQRAVDVVAAVIGLVLVAPAMVVIGIMIRAETPGPVFFTQQRLGRDSKPFRIYKFRKFHHNVNNSGYGVTLRKDPRMTAIGRLLERSKLDELPQLWNVLRGDMSLVGPRPETLQFADCFAGRYRQVLERRPGLFGPSQTLFRNESLLYPADRDPHEFYRTVLFPTKASIDLAYFANRSFVSDLIWILRGLQVTVSQAPDAISTDRLAAARWSTRLPDSIAGDPEPLIRKPLL